MQNSNICTDLQVGTNVIKGNICIKVFKLVYNYTRWLQHTFEHVDIQPFNENPLIRMEVYYCTNMEIVTFMEIYSC